ncbi:Protein PECTIC ARABINOGALACTAN SYNTHESIS-RELATED [Glycine max]|nr:Protein PECTIC ARABINOGALACTAN SYNTHESIS-RELATED [Glycine max]
MTSPPHVPLPECHLPHLREQLWVQFEQCHRPQKRRSGRVLRCKEEVEEVATDLGVGGDRLRRVSGELGLLDFTERVLLPWQSNTGASDSSPLIPDNHLANDNEHDRHLSKDRDRHMCFFFTDDPMVSPHNSRISLVFTLLLLLVGLVSHFTIFNNLVSPHLSGCIFRFTTKSLMHCILLRLSNAPYLCKKDGIVLHCPHNHHHFGKILSLPQHLGSPVLSARMHPLRAIISGAIPSLFYSEEIAVHDFLQHNPIVENKAKDNSFDDNVDFVVGNVKLITTKEVWDQYLEEARRDDKIDSKFNKV